MHDRIFAYLLHLRALAQLLQAGYSARGLTAISVTVDRSSCIACGGRTNCEVNNCHWHFAHACTAHAWLGEGNRRLPRTTPIASSGSCAGIAARLWATGGAPARCSLAWLLVRSRIAFTGAAGQSLKRPNNCDFARSLLIAPRKHHIAALQRHSPLLVPSLRALASARRSPPESNPN